MLSPTDVTQTNISNTSPLQPMGFGEILDTIFSLYRKHFLLFLGIITVYFLGSLVTYLLDGSLQGSNRKDLVPNFVSIPFVLVSMGGVIIATAAIFLDRHITSSDALKQTLRRFWYLLGIYLLWAAVLIIPFIVSLLFLSSFVRRGIFSFRVLFIPFAFLPFSIYFAVRWGFVFEVLLLEKTNVKNAFKRSSELVRGTWWRVFGLLVLILLLSVAILYIVEISLGSIFILAKAAGGTDFKELIQWSVMEEDLGSSNLIFYAIMTCTDLILKTLIFPIWVIGIVLLYFDLRIRKEGFDIEIQVNSPDAMSIQVE
ncbi:MAG: hypothetical protein OXU51_18225 [Candidatus Poribacteria bacterium]|nr:hypothetical protein [Candidatus Poribacteria bacterium]